MASNCGDGFKGVYLFPNLSRVDVKINSFCFVFFFNGGGDFPGGPGVKNPPSSAGDLG